MRADAKMKLSEGKMLEGNNFPIAAPFVAECQAATPQVQLICLFPTLAAGPSENDVMPLSPVLMNK